MLQWKIGDVTVKRVVESEVPVKYHPKYAFLTEATPEALKAMPWLYPHVVTADGDLRLSIHALLVEAPGLRMVVDTCIGNDKPRAMNRNQPLATEFLKQGRFEKAETEYREAVDIDSNYAPAHLGLGNVFTHENRLAEAETCKRPLSFPQMDFQIPV